MVSRVIGDLVPVTYPTELARDYHLVLGFLGVAQHLVIYRWVWRRWRRPAEMANAVSLSGGDRGGRRCS